jgi:hypothetical protein
VFRAQGCADALLAAAATAGYPDRGTLETVGAMFDRFIVRRG